MVFKKVSLFGVNYAVIDYKTATDIIIESAIKKESFGMSALAVHGLVECVHDKELMDMVNSLDLVVPDGQPIRWAMNIFHHTNLKDRVSGPDLSSYVLEKADILGLKLYLYGSKENVLNALIKNINEKYPNLQIAGVHPDRFREATPEEDLNDIKKINDSGANIVWVGRGCPRQERWVANHKEKINAALMAVGAAFDFHAGTLKKAPRWMEKSGTEWFYRLCMEPRRLWKRYLYTNSFFIYLFIKQSLGAKRK